MTSRVRNTQETRCDLSESYRSIFYLHASRRYGGQGSGDSTLIIRAYDKDVNIPVVIHNDKITLQKDSNVCYFPTVSQDETSFWIRFRLHAMLDLRKTFVSLSIMPMDGEHFIDCVKFEIDTIMQQFRLSLVAKTQTGMEQVVHNIVQHRPGLKRQKAQNSDLTLRVNRLEERMRRLQNTLTEYVESHDNHVEHVDKLKKSIQTSISETHNRIVTRSNSHAMIYCFFFAVLIFCGAAYIRWKRTEERRFHLY